MECTYHSVGRMVLHDLERHGEERREQYVGQMDDQAVAGQIEQAKGAHPHDGQVVDVSVQVLEHESHELQVDLGDVNRLPEEMDQRDDRVEFACSIGSKRIGQLSMVKLTSDLQAEIRICRIMKLKSL